MSDRLSQLKVDEEKRHQREVEVIKRKYEQKIALEKERQKQANDQLLEESGDIDQQMQLFSKDLFKGKMPEEKLQIDRDFKNKVTDLKTGNKELIERAR
jgi:hypothetical protein